jgi:hypothetical protein
MRPKKACSAGTAIQRRTPPAARAHAARVRRHRTRGADRAGVAPRSRDIAEAHQGRGSPGRCQPCRCGRRSRTLPTLIARSKSEDRPVSLSRISVNLDATGLGAWGKSRHHTLRHAVAWSYDHLDDAEKTLLERCSVFAGGFDLQSACAMAGFDDVNDYAVLDRLDALVRKSLLVADRSAGRTTRRPWRRYRCA